MSSRTKWIRAFGWFPVRVFQRHPPQNFRGYTRIPFWPVVWIEISPDFWDDEHILIHELQHVEDYLRNPFVYWRQYKTAEGRLHYETRAYARQYTSYGEDSEDRFKHFVHLLNTRYRLNMAPRMIESVLRGEINRLEV